MDLRVSVAGTPSSSSREKKRLLCGESSRREIVIGKSLGVVLVGSWGHYPNP